MSAHWACALIGQQWTPQRNCWWLVRHVFREQLGIDLPIVDVEQSDAPENVGAIKRASAASGWRPAGGDPQEWDVLLMRGPLGRHVGVLVNANGRLGLLHNTEDAGVCWQPLDDVQRLGFTQMELWRRHA